MIVNAKRAAGVVAGGKAWTAKCVVAGVNPKLLFDRLIPDGAVDRDVAARMHGWKCESATFRMNVALAELPKFTVLPKKGNHLTAGIIMAPSMAYMHERLARRAQHRLVEEAGRRDGHSLDARPDASRPRASMSRACSASISATTSARGEAGTRSARRRRTRSSRWSTAMRPASRPRCSGRQIHSPARPRTALRTDRRRHLPRQDGARPIVQRAADDRRRRLSNAAQGPLSVRIGRPPGRRGDRRSGPQCRQGDAGRPAACGGAGD